MIPEGDLFCRIRLLAHSYLLAQSVCIQSVSGGHRRLPPPFFFKRWKSYLECISTSTTINNERESIQQQLRTKKNPFLYMEI